MVCCSSDNTKILPKEYKKAAEALLEENGPSREAVLDFADKLGVGTDYRKLDTGWKNTEEQEHFLHSFRNNLDLLIQKTWVEKADEDRKEKLLARVPGFIAVIKEENYAGALGEFQAILEELAWLLFGTQSHKEDFFDYCLRIDHQMGLFWWYGGHLQHFLAAVSKDGETQKMALLLGLCYLTEF